MSAQMMSNYHNCPSPLTNPETSPEQGRREEGGDGRKASGGLFCPAPPSSPWAQASWFLLSIQRPPQQVPRTHQRAVGLESAGSIALASQSSGIIDVSKVEPQSAATGRNLQVTQVSIFTCPGHIPQAHTSRHGTSVPALDLDVL